MRNKKKKRGLSQLEIIKGMRKFWNISQVTKIKKNSRKKSRAKEKQDFRREYEI